MEVKKVQVQIVAFAFMGLFVIAMGESCPPLVRYASCLRFLQEDQRVPGLNDACCVMIRATSESCLCDTARKNSNRGIDLDKALSLPKACGLKVPPNTYCGDKQVPN